MKTSRLINCRVKLKISESLEISESQNDFTLSSLNSFSFPNAQYLVICVIFYYICRSKKYNQKSND